MATQTTKGLFNVQIRPVREQTIFSAPSKLYGRAGVNKSIGLKNPSLEKRR